MNAPRVSLQTFAFIGLLVALLFAFGSLQTTLLVLTSNVPQLQAHRISEILNLIASILAVGFFWWLRRWARRYPERLQPNNEITSNVTVASMPNADLSDAGPLRRIRVAAAVSCLVALIALSLAWQKNLIGEPGAPGAWLMLALFCLGPMALFFAIQAATGLALRDVSVAWDAIRWWQRGLIGTVVVFYVFWFLFGFLARAIGVDSSAVP